MATDVMISASGLTKSYGSFRALDKVSFEVNRGEVVGFLGPNGAGKSTTMRILTCFISPTQRHGEGARLRRVRRPARGAREHRLPAAARAALHRDERLEYLRFASRHPAARPGEVRQARRRTSSRSAASRRCSARTSGTCRTAIASASASGRRSSTTRRSSSSTSRRATSTRTRRPRSSSTSRRSAKDRTVLLSTHNLAEVEAACARAIIVRKGRVVADGPLDEIRAESGKVRYVVWIQESAGATPYRGRRPAPRRRARSRTRFAACTA